jgi:phosphatidylglycerol---prolipoprotein diacylglyceryl transferase
VPIAFYLPGEIPIYTFSLLLGLSATLGLAWVAWQSPTRQVRRNVEAGLMALLGGLAGGRTAYALANWEYYQFHQREILEVYRGGLSASGALAGGCLAVLLLAALIHTSPGQLAGALLPLLATLAISAWLGCWLAGCAYGPRTTQWWGLPAWDEWGGRGARFPVQLLGALLALGWFWLLDRIRGKYLSPSRAAILGVMSLSLQMLALSHLRVDPTVTWRGLRSDTWGALALTVFAGLALLVSFLIELVNKQRITAKSILL